MFTFPCQTEGVLSRISHVFAALLLVSCVGSHDTRPIVPQPGSWHATIIAAGECGGKDCPKPGPGGVAACRTKVGHPGDNHTGILLVQGSWYLFQAQPSLCFADSILPLQNLDGWDFPLLQPFCLLKRRPGEPFFTLIGTINGKAPFRIHEGMCFQAPASGELVCYVNDWSFMYGNNQGAVKLQVTPWAGGSR
ncbi:MAG: hypothetical protein B7Z37_25990 [Verrucomicrobia bacterium 12-59-8]|nr:MAG: hypothetical protein B7Z37_25990 [Verrucomicrobia bacterium 12-59-8]